MSRLSATRAVFGYATQLPACLLVVLGRKNYYGSRSRRGTEVAAIFFTVLESAKLSGVNPRDYLRIAAESAISPHGRATLPHKLD